MCCDCVSQREARVLVAHVQQGSQDLVSMQIVVMFCLYVCHCVHVFVLCFHVLFLCFALCLCFVLI